jgi:hypothetical protein
MGVKEPSKYQGGVSCTTLSIGARSAVWGGSSGIGHHGRVQQASELSYDSPHRDQDVALDETDGASVMSYIQREFGRVENVQVENGKS